MQVASLAAITSSPRGTRSSSLIDSCARLPKFEDLLGVFGEDLARRGQRDSRSEALERVAFNSCSSCRTCALIAGCVR